MIANISLCSKSGIHTQTKMEGNQDKKKPTKYNAKNYILRLRDLRNFSFHFRAYNLF